MRLQIRTLCRIINRLARVEHFNFLTVTLRLHNVSSDVFIKCIDKWGI